MNRKTFLKSLALATSTIVFGNNKNLYSETNIHNNKNQAPKLFGNSAIVLGGGLSGLYAGHLLKKKGIGVRIVESSPRLGGRILSYRDPESGIVGDLGGEFIGEKQSTIRSLLKEFDLNLVSPDWNNVDTLWDDRRLSLKSKNSLEKLLALQSKLPVEQIQGLDRISLFKYLQYQGFSDGELEDLERVVKVFFGESSRNLSSHYLLSCIESKRSYFHKLYRIEGGAESLIDRLKASFHSGEIFLNDGVVKVSQDSTGVHIELESGKILRSKHLICTLPTYAISEIQWTPSLPRDKIFALLRVGYGQIRKEIVNANQLLLSPQEGNGIVDWVFPLKGSLNTILSSGGRATAYDRSPTSITRDIVIRSIQILEPKSIETLDLPRYGFGKGAVAIYTPSTIGLKETLESSIGNIHFAGEYLSDISGTMDAALVSAFRAVTKIQ